MRPADDVAACFDFEPPRSDPYAEIVEELQQLLVSPLSIRAEIGQLFRERPFGRHEVAEQMKRARLEARGDFTPADERGSPLQARSPFASGRPPRPS